VTVPGPGKRSEWAQARARTSGSRVDTDVGNPEESLLTGREDRRCSKFTEMFHQLSR
jgi:hypothetical protein